MNRPTWCALLYACATASLLLLGGCFPKSGYRSSEVRWFGGDYVGKGPETIIAAAAAHLQECGYSITARTSSSLTANKPHAYDKDNPSDFSKMTEGITIKVAVADRGRDGFQVETVGNSDSFYAIKDTTWNISMANAAAEIDAQKAFIRALTPPVDLPVPPDFKLRR